MKFLIAVVLAMTQVIVLSSIHGGYCTCPGNKQFNQKTFVCEQLATEQKLANCSEYTHQYGVDKTQNYKCTKCKDNYYIDQTSKCRPLANCVKGIYTANPEAHDCTKCKVNYHKDNKICVLNIYIPDCATYSGPADAVVCNICYDGFGKNPTGTQCNELGIKYCITKVGQKCAVCRNTFFVVKGGASCGELTFYEHVDAINNCTYQAYVVNKYQCYACSSGFYLDDQSVCQANPTEGYTFVANCQEYHLVLSNLKCKTCDPSKSGPVNNNVCVALGVENCSHYKVYAGITNKIFCNKCKNLNSLNFSKLDEDKVTCGECPIGTIQKFQMPLYQGSKTIRKAIKNINNKQQKLSDQIIQVTIMILAFVLSFIF